MKLQRQLTMLDYCQNIKAMTAFLIAEAIMIATICLTAFVAINR